jgi:His-Xaa-Ser system radical SAM maturase HxsC
MPVTTVDGELQPISDGDVVALQTSGAVDTLFRVESQHNSLFVTEQCNSFCLMCSQPPRKVDDIEERLALNSRVVRLMPRSLKSLGITGGEPTLLGTHLAELLSLCRSALPLTEIAILSNGRRLADPSFAETIGEATSDKILFTIPLYSDNPLGHDFIVQANGAFNETVLGFYNLAALGIRSEVRVVLHRQSAPRLAQLAKFVQKNLPFVERVVFMGMEMTGFARANESQLWIEPADYMNQLADAIEHLTTFGVSTAIYNLPRCLVPSSLWPNLKQSISDWKREYLPACETCSEKSQCSGVFGTSSRLSLNIRPFEH